MEIKHHIIQRLPPLMKYGFYACDFVLKMAIARFLQRFERKKKTLKGKKERFESRCAQLFTLNHCAYIFHTTVFTAYTQTGTIS